MELLPLRFYYGITVVTCDILNIIFYSQPLCSIAVGPADSVTRFNNDDDRSRDEPDFQ